MKHFKYAIFIVPFLFFNYVQASTFSISGSVSGTGSGSELFSKYYGLTPSSHNLEGQTVSTVTLYSTAVGDILFRVTGGNCGTQSLTHFTSDGSGYQTFNYPFTFPSDLTGCLFDVDSSGQNVGYTYFGSPINDYVWLQSWDGTPPDTTTRIVSMTPADGSNLPSATPVTFTAHLYINPEDVGNVIKLNISLRNIDQNVLLLGDFSSETYQMFFGVATTTGDWYYSTNILLADGNYRFNIEADSCVSAFGTCLLQVPFLGIHLYENTQFIVGTSTFIGNISQNSFAQTNNIFASTTATSTSALSRTCYPFSGNFDTIQCVSFLIIPDAGYLSDTLNNFRVNVSTHFPLGYITDLYGILSTTTQGTLEVVDVTLPMFGNPHIRLDLTNVLDPILNATTSQFFNGDISSSTETFYEVTSFYWDILVYAMTVFYIIGRILGSHLIPKIRL